MLELNPHLVYIVMQTVEYEGSDIERVFSLAYDACAYRIMLQETRPIYTDVTYDVVAYGVD